MEPQRVAERVAHFRIVQKLGQGGMGVVYKAIDDKLGRPVALKLLPPAFTSDPERRARFLREARAAAAVVHPNIAVVYEVGDEGGAVFIAMEWIDGRTLRETYGRAPMPAREAVRVFLEIVRGLACAHDARIVHRDLKPDNVMINAAGQVKILDFGLAKLIASGAPSDPGGDDAHADTRSDPGLEATQQQTITATGASPQGTPQYMSPEHARGLPVDQRSDIFSLGAMLYEMVSGTSPFTGPTTVDVLVSVISLQPPPVPRIPPDLMRVIHRCLQKDPARRYQSCSELIAELEEWHAPDTIPQVPGGEPASPRPGAVGPRPAALRMGRGPVLFAALAVGAMVAGVMILSVNRSERPASGRTAIGGAGGRGSIAAVSVGPRVERLTTNSRENNIYTGALSPDGRFLAYATDDDESMVLTVATGEKVPIALPRKNILDITWTRDSASVLATTEVPSGQSAIWSMPIGAPAGTRPRKVAEPGHGPAAAPDGKRIAYIGPGGVWVAGLDGQGARVVAPTRGGAYAGALAWSPGGKRIALSVEDADGTTTLETAAATGEGGRRSVPEAKNVADTRGGVAWLADGRVAYTSSGPGVGAVSMIVIDEETGTARGPSQVLIPEEFLAQELSATSDGQRLAFKRVDVGVDVYVASLADTAGGELTPRRLTLDDAEDVPVDWTSDGQEVLFTVRRQRHSNLYRQRLDAREPTRIRAVEELEGVRASADGAWLLGWHKTGKGWELRRVPRGPTGNEVVVATVEGQNQPTVRCARAPADLCLVGTQVATEDTLVLRPLAGTGAHGRSPLGEPLVELPADSNPEAWDLAPAGDRVAVIAPDSSIKVVRLTGDRSRSELGVGRPCDPRSITWTADGSGLLVVCTGSRKLDNSLIRLGLDGSLRSLWRVKPSRMFRPSASPDGRWVMFALRSYDPDFWLLSEL